jgi:hypothetical protein
VTLSTLIEWSLGAIITLTWIALQEINGNA